MCVLLFMLSLGGGDYRMHFFPLMFDLWIWKYEVLVTLYRIMSFKKWDTWSLRFIFLPRIVSHLHTTPYFWCLLWVLESKWSQQLQLTQVSGIAGRIFITWATREAPYYMFIDHLDFLSYALPFCTLNFFLLCQSPWAAITKYQKLTGFSTT